MNLLSLVLWGLAGIALAFFSLKTQTWSVTRITPTHPGRSMALVVGGAILRWLITGAIFVLALSRSIQAMLSVFILFLITRTLFIFIWQDALIQKPLQANQMKD
ncbi:MAG TPA: hypothetical protein DF984_08100 [Anaerolineaceae bacterium]|jgi:hypothetical protein|nr:hypothetical protein [Anaerolineaceae bacterium]